MSALLVGSLVKGLFDIGKQVVDGKIGKEEGKNKLKLAGQQLEITIQQIVSGRHETDMKSDSWLSKNIRPMAFMFMLGMTTLFTFTDGNLGDFTVKEQWVNLWTTLTITFATFYAGGRTWEKVHKIKYDKPKPVKKEIDPLNKYDWEDEDGD